MSDQNTVLLFSYVPLLDQTQFSDVLSPNSEDLADLHAAVAEIHNCADGCLWMLDDQTVMPVLIIPQAREIYEHLMWWSEDEPAEWFHLQIDRRADDEYVLAIVPNIERTVERWKTRWLATHSELIEDSSWQYTIVSLPLICHGHGGTYESLKDRIGETCRVGLTDSAPLLENFAPDQLADDDIFKFGPLRVIREKIPETDT